MTSAVAVFRALDTPPSADGSLTAAPFPGHLDHRVAKTVDGNAVVLVRVREDSGRSALMPVSMQNLLVTYNTHYTIRSASGEVDQGVFTALTCLGEDPSFVRYFFTVVGSLLESVGNEPTAAELSSVIRTVVQLFCALILPATKTVQGLWAELFLIATSHDKAVVARAWHATPTDRYDFVMGRERVEVKSSGRRERRHHFSLEQLNPPIEAEVWIASLFVERAGGGMTLEAILDRACDGISSPEAARLRVVAAETLGAGFAVALVMAFDFEIAEDSVRYYEASAVPRPSLPLPPEITDLRYVADLSRVAPIEPLGAQASVLLSALP